LGANPAATRVREIGLSNYLAFEVVRPSEVVQPTAVFGVDFLPAGTSPISPDALATHRMRDLLGQLRQTYSIILVAGPPVGSATDLQILAAYQDGAVILFDVPNTTNAYTQELFRNYRKIGVPFLGCVHLAG
jgi:Mrp family chromosome partitioning ATPase